MAYDDITSLYENLPDNSKKARIEAAQAQQLEKTDGKRSEKVVKGKVKTKKNEMRRLSDIFISEDVANVKEFILLDVLVPSIKNALYDIIVGSLDKTLFGGRRSSSSGGRRSNADTITYTSYSKSSKQDDRNYSRPRTSSGYGYDDILFDNRGEAEAVLDRMDELIESYGEVRVADMYDMAGITGNYTDNRYGWTDISTARIERTRQGYLIRMPRAGVLKK